MIRRHVGNGDTRCAWVWLWSSWGGFACACAKYFSVVPFSWGQCSFLPSHLRMKGGVEVNAEFVLCSRYQLWKNSSTAEGLLGSWLCSGKDCPSTQRYFPFLPMGRRVPGMGWRAVVWNTRHSLPKTQVFQHAILETFEASLYSFSRSYWRIPNQTKTYSKKEDTGSGELSVGEGMVGFPAPGGGNRAEAEGEPGAASGGRRHGRTGSWRWRVQPSWWECRWSGQCFRWNLSSLLRKLSR